MKKFIKGFLMVAIVLAAGFAAWFVMGTKKASSVSEASNYYGAFTFIRFDNTNTKWDACYAYCWTNKGDVDIYELKTQEVNTFACNINGDAYDKILFKNTPGKDNWDNQTADYDMVSGPTNYTFIPTKTDGKVEGKFVEHDYSVVTVKYSNDTIADPHVYFQIGDGKWSDGFGFQMKNKGDYSEADIYVADAAELKMCFNNGDNNTAWDNNNSKDYHVNINNHGVKIITIDNGEMEVK
ncbi:MAG: hypothetical protein K6G26_06330 [Lachnospiraceae bacterium]|nr:hypothetical protein [Lachnospiraceae bacterium]